MPFSEDDIVALIPRLNAYALGLSKSRHAADDLVQDVLERAWRNRQHFDAGSSLTGWLFRILRNRFIDVHRGSKPLTEDIDGRHAAKLASAPAQHWTLQYDELISVVDQLPSKMREAFYLVMISGLTHEEAAAVLDVPLGTLKSWIRRGRDLVLQTVDFSGAD